VAVAPACLAEIMSFFVKTHRGRWPAPVAAVTGLRIPTREMLRTWSRHKTRQWLPSARPPLDQDGIEAPLKRFWPITEPAASISARSIGIELLHEVREPGAVLRIGP